jgi:4-amino-4-deoxy-L-arabinose transferase-like glycosyltransferase
VKRRLDALKLIGFLLLVYAPFLGFRVARMAGDEKMYVATALEMEKAGTWFLQRFWGQPNYYKGPLHYLLLRVGFDLFGHTMWATVYMNLILLLIGAYSIYRLARRHGPERPRGLALFAGAAFGVSAGVYGYMFASQMEAELASAFAIAINLFDRSFELHGRTKESSRVAEWAFWAVAGLTGWFKSPLYSALLGCSALIGWALQGQLRERLSSRKTWGPIALGVAICALGYLPAFLQEREAVVRTYFYRETFGKGDNGGTWWEAVFALTTSFLFPWCFLAFGTYAQAMAGAAKLGTPPHRGSGVIRLERHCLAWLVPSVIFFVLFPYHGQSYNVPMIGPVILWLTCEIAAARGGWIKVQSAALAVTALCFTALSAFSAALALRVQPRPPWLWAGTLPLLAIGSSVTAAYFFQSAALRRAREWSTIALSTVGFFVGFGILIANVGDREIWDLRTELLGEKQVYYAEMAHNQWSEYGYLNCMLPVQVSPIFDEPELAVALGTGRKILVPGMDTLKRVRQVAQGHYPGRQLSEVPWRRWKLQGQDDSGTPLWKKAWETADFSLLERDYFVVALRGS